MHTRSALPAALAVVLLAASVPAAEPDVELAYAEKALQDAKQASDGAALLAFFRARTLSDEERARLAAQVRLLGDGTFAVRERASRDLVRAGRAAVPFLKAALHDSDLEIKRRATRCLESIESGADRSLTVAAARVLAVRKPDGAVGVLLAYLPFAEDEHLEEAVFDALAAVGLRDAKPAEALTKALADKEPMRRAAAAFVVGKAGADQHRALRPLLGDTDARVRYRAAAALVRAGDKAAVAALLTLLSDGPLPLGWQAHELLYRIAGDLAPAAALRSADAAERRKVRETWEAWWKKNEAKIDLAKVKWEDALLGLNVVCECDSTPGGQIGKVWECRTDGKPRWQIENLKNPSDYQLLPGGRVLIAEFQGNQVSERDKTGKVLWSKQVNSFPTTCLRLPNGNTFIGTYNEILEVTPDGKTVFTHRSNGGSIYRAKKLRNDHILYVCSKNQIIELDAAGKQVRTIPVQNTGVFSSVEALPGGRYLVGLYSANKVIEVDVDGKVHWQCEVQTPSSVSRLPNGNILVSSMDAKAIVEIDRDRKEVWKQTTQGRPFLVRRY